MEILGYLINSKQSGFIIEKPTAKLYYDKLKADLKGIFLELPIAALQNKVKYLRTQYLKAIEWQEQTGQGVDGESVRSHILTMCPHYDELDEIYSERPSVVIPAKVDTGNFELERRQENNIEPVLNEIDDYSYDYIDYNEDFLDNIENEPPNNPSNMNTPNKEPAIKVNLQRTAAQNFVASEATQDTEDVEIVPKSVNPFQKRRQPRYVNNSVSQLVILENNRQELLLKRHKLEQEKNEKQLKIENERIDLEKSRLDFDRMKWEKEFELNRELQLRKIEKEEKLAELELKLKYGIADK